jgi:hypothetical protein
MLQLRWLMQVVASSFDKNAPLQIVTRRSSANRRQIESGNFMEEVSSDGAPLHA